MVTLKVLQEKGLYLTPILFALFVFFIPISPSIKSIFFALVVASVLFNPRYNQYLFYAYNTYWGRIALLFVLFIALACFWSPAPLSMRLMVLSKYSKLLYLPILAAGFIGSKTRIWSINAYILSMLVTCVVSVAKLKGWVHMGYDDRDPGELFYNHILTGFMMSVACYIAAVMSYKNNGWKRLAYGVAVLITSCQILFLNTGRTGYVVYVLLMGLFLLQTLQFKKALLGLILFASMVLVAYSFSPFMQKGVKDIINNLASVALHTKSTPFKEQKNSNSLSYRLMFHDYARSLFVTHPILGFGTGAFQYQYSLDKPFLSFWGPELNDPHSQYWMTLSEQGIVGILLLALFLGSLLYAALSLHENKELLLGILLAFCISAFFDSILCYSTAGYLLIVISALCFGEFIERYSLKKDRELRNSLA